MQEERVQIRQLMSRDIVAIELDSTVREAISKMEQHRIHELPVMQNSTLKGWVNYDTLIQRAHVPASAKATSVMVPGMRLAQTTDIVSAADTMIRQNVRAVAVVDAKGQMVGVLSRTDLMRAAAEIDEIAALPLERVMTRDLETAAEKDSIDEAARRLREHSIRQLLVLDSKGKLVGEVGREAIMHAFTTEDRRGTRPHGKDNNIGSPGSSKNRNLTLSGQVRDSVTLPGHATIGQAIDLMLKRQRAAVVVVEEGFPVGVVSRSNILERVAARGIQPGPLVQVIGLSDFVDGSTLDLIHAHARNTLKKIENEFRVEFLSLHFKVYKQKTDGDSKFALSGHLSTEQKFVIAKADDWDPMKALSSVLQELERRSFEHKELRLERRKKGTGRKARFYTAVR
jgi:CBS domain-containing protein/ribosome-associated translation inhibitor RaiA